MPLIPLLIAAAFASPIELAGARRTDCSAYRMNDDIGNKPVDGIPLVSRVRTGMTREEVEAIHPGLTRRSRALRLEILPGLHLAAGVPLFGSESATYVTARGGRHEKAAATITRHFGVPLRDIEMKEVPSFATVIPKSSYYKVSRYSWCDGPRVWLMSATDDAFTLEVRVLQQKDER
ncbi:MAG: hypothetical protein M3Q52_10195 [Pseudomonadota bacterium]|nr:hypothetical protein [Pseudomonadota bacterium]